MRDGRSFFTQTASCLKQDICLERICASWTYKEWIWNILSKNCCEDVICDTNLDPLFFFLECFSFHLVVKARPSAKVCNISIKFLWDTKVILVKQSFSCFLCDLCSSASIVTASTWPTACDRNRAWKKDFCYKFLITIAPIYLNMRCYITLTVWRIC